MKKRIGVGAVRKKDELQKSFAVVGKQMEETKIASVKETLIQFKEALEDFASKHKNKINSDPEFRLQFHKMCRSVGVDPLASSKGFWADVLGVGEFYYELAVQIIQVCLQTRATNGGIMSLGELHSRIVKHGGKSRAKITIEDIKRSIEKIGILGGGFKIITSEGREMLLSVPMEFNMDHELLLREAQQCSFVRKERVLQRCNWSPERFVIAMNPLIREGVVWIDEHSGGETDYYFPSLLKALM